MQVQEQGQDQDLLVWVSRVLPASITYWSGIADSLSVKWVTASCVALLF